MKPYIGMLDHSLLSPSGHISKRSKERALQPLKDAINADYAADRKSYAKQMQAGKPRWMRQYADFLRGLASRGMKPRSHIKEAERLETEAAKLE